MAWSKFLPLKRYLEDLGVNCLLGVVPECRDAKLEVEPARDDFYDLVRAWQANGDTIVQHGAYHVYETPEAGLLGVNPGPSSLGCHTKCSCARSRKAKPFS